MGFRPLSAEEIKQLERQDCFSSDWTKVYICPKTQLKYIKHVRFSGEIYMGCFEKSFEMPGGVHKHTGLYNVVLHNVEIGDNCCIENVKNYVANFHIEEDCFIENVDTLLTDGESSFGNGVEVVVLNETGGNEVTIHDNLSAHEAYIEARYKDFPLAVESLKTMARNYAKQKSSNKGEIKHHTSIINAGYICNVRIGEYCKIEGADRLQNGTIISTQASPVKIGSGVTMDDFIVQKGSTIVDDVSLSRCYVGEACTMKHGYSATDSLFFSNCHEENGEACSVFAGPFTVTHHKSSLLIAGMFSFMNAGSGSNQSNHLYKLGPVHHGLLERGSKTTSDSYILWPARIGAFSLIMGRHTSHVDTSDMPFSYLIENNGETCLIPAINLRSVGTIRDSRKWPQRDKRIGKWHLDCVNFNLLSPYTVGKMMKAVHTLEELIQTSKGDKIPYKNAFIYTHSALRGIELYKMAIRKFIGNSLTSHLERTDCSTPQTLLKNLPSIRKQGEGEWLDLSGLIAPKREIETLLSELETNSIKNTLQLNERFQNLHLNYYKYEWTWAYKLMLEFYKLNPEEITLSTLLFIIEDWRKAVCELDEMLFLDARKDIQLIHTAQYGFTEHSVDNIEEEFENNPFVQDVKQHIASKTILANYWIEILKSLIKK